MKFQQFPSRFVTFSLLLLTLCLALPALAQRGEGQLDPSQPTPPLTVDDIIQRFAAKENSSRLRANSTPIART